MGRGYTVGSAAKVNIYFFIPLIQYNTYLAIDPSHSCDLFSNN